jgi:hypothetical protein
VGQKIVFNEALIVKDEVVVSNGYQDEITNITDGYLEKADLHYSNIRLKNQSGKFKMLQDSQRAKYDKKLEYFLSMAKSNSSFWKDYYSLKEFFADIRLPYAITSYKSQGSTYENVYIDVADIKRNRDKTLVLRHLYVGITRASKNVYLVT